ncbi:MAG: GxxExxY protein [Desulfobacteraceae bacterium]
MVFFESVYQECLEKELESRDIPFEPQKELVLAYKGTRLNQVYKPDFIFYDSIIGEIKAVREIANEHRAQVMNYLKATGYRLGLLINFEHYPKSTVERIII